MSLLCDEKVRRRKDANNSLEFGAEIWCVHHSRGMGARLREIEREDIRHLNFEIGVKQRY